MKTSHLFLRKHYRPGTQQHDLTPSTLAGHRFKKRTFSQLERSCSWVCHLLSVLGLGAETFGAIAEETIDETLIHWDFLYSNGFNKHVNKRLNRSRGPVKGLCWIKRQPSWNILRDIQICPHDIINSSVLWWEIVGFSWTEGRYV